MMRLFIITMLISSSMIIPSNSGMGSNNYRDKLTSYSMFDADDLLSIKKRSLVANKKSSKNLLHSLNPHKYIVGPGDEFFVNMLSNYLSINEYIIVSPLGDLILPELGLINVNKLTLNDTFILIEQKYSDKFENIEFNITLTDIRDFKIRIMGLKDGPNYIISNPLEKLSDVIDNIFKLLPESTMNMISKRKVSLYRNEKLLNFDLYGLYNSYDLNDNPFVIEQDIIKFSRVNNHLYIYGGVRYEGVYEYKENDRLYDFINLIGGFTVDADTNNIEITRIVDGNNIITSLSHNEILHPYDHINVQRKKDYNPRDLVYIKGEVNSPGLYKLKENMTFEELLSNAGGYTKNADKSRIIIQNEYFNNKIDYEYERIQLIPLNMRNSSEISYVNSKKLLNNEIIISTDGISIFEYTLNHNDQIEVPRAIDYIEVIGGVNYPGIYPYNNSYTIKDYIKQSGGKSSKSTNKVYIMDIYNKKNRIRNLSQKLNSGEGIFIETRKELNMWNAMKESMAIVGQLATLIAVIQSAD